VRAVSSGYPNRKRMLYLAAGHSRDRSGRYALAYDLDINANKVFFPPNAGRSAPPRRGALVKRDFIVQASASTPDSKSRFVDSESKLVTTRLAYSIFSLLL